MRICSVHKNLQSVSNDGQDSRAVRALVVCRGGPPELLVSGGALCCVGKIAFSSALCHPEHCTMQSAHQCGCGRLVAALTNWHALLSSWKPNVWIVVPSCSNWCQLGQRGMPLMCSELGSKQVLYPRVADSLLWRR